MFDNITRDQFRIDTVIPAIQTAATIAAATVAGRMGHYSVAATTTYGVGLTASTLSAVAANFFANVLYQYLAIPVTVVASFVLHRFIAGEGLNVIASIKEIAIISAILVAVKLVADNIGRLKKVEEKVVEAVKEVVAVEKGVLEGADVVAKTVEKGAAEASEKIEEMEKELEKK